MKRKVFYQHHIGIIIFLVFLSVIFCLGVYFIVDCFVNRIISNRNWWLIALIFIAMIYILSNILSFAKHRIVLDDKKIFTPGDWQGKSHKVQYKTTVKYEDIIDLKIITSTKNSKNKTITASVPSSYVLKPYLEFTLKNGNKQRIFIQFFTKKQWAKIIDEIKLRIINVGNNIEIQNTLEMINNVDTKTYFGFDDD